MKADPLTPPGIPIVPNPSAPENPAESVDPLAAEEEDLRALEFRPAGERLLLHTAGGESVCLGNFYRGRSAFLICSGPSLKGMDLAQLGRRGILTMAVNNAAAVYRPHLWVTVDDPGNFHDKIWKDPGILKFCPAGHQRKRLRVKRRGRFDPSSFTVGHMPGVFFFRRKSTFDAATFLTESAISWGCGEGIDDGLGHKGCRSVMLVALRLLVYLGIRRIFIVGADFRMEEGRENYAFPQDRTPQSVRGNNATYAALNARFAALRPHLEAMGVEVFNCTPDSPGGGGLTAFERLSFSAGVQMAGAECAGELDTLGWYDERAKPADPSQCSEGWYARTYGRLYAAGYHKQPDGSWGDQVLIPWMLRSLEFDSVLDLGCAKGGAVATLAAAGKRAEGIDASLEAVTDGLRLGRTLHHGSFTDLSRWKDGAFDVVMSCDAFEHLWPEHAEKAIAEACRVAGRFVCMKISTRLDELKRWQEVAGHHLHLCVRPLHWWIERFARYGEVVWQEGDCFCVRLHSKS